MRGAQFRNTEGLICLGEGTVSQAKFRKRDPSGIARAGGSKDRKREQGRDRIKCSQLSDSPGQAVIWGPGVGEKD